MWSPFQHIVLVLCLCALISATPAPLTIPRDTHRSKDSQLTNLNTTLGQIVPTAFTVVPGILTGPTLPETSCLLQTLVALGRTASENFNDRQNPSIYVDPLFAIELDGRRTGASLDRKYAVWGLYGVLAHMLREDDYRARLYTLRWQTVIVGRIRLSSRTPPRLSVGNSTTSEMGTSAPENNVIQLSNATTAFNSTTLGTRFIEGNLEYSITPVGQTIAEENIYMTVATALVKTAPIPITEPIHMLNVDTRAFNSHLRIADPYDPPRSSPPFLLKLFLIKVLCQIPALMVVEGNHWSEVELGVKIDNVIVATGSLRRVESMSGLGSGSLDVKVSTS
jgi:hypothetical protein